MRLQSLIVPSLAGEEREVINQMLEPLPDWRRVLGAQVSLDTNGFRIAAAKRSDSGAFSARTIYQEYTNHASVLSVLSAAGPTFSELRRKRSGIWGGVDRWALLDDNKAVSKPYDPTSLSSHWIVPMPACRRVISDSVQASRVSNGPTSIGW